MKDYGENAGERADKTLETKNKGRQKSQRRTWTGRGRQGSGPWDPTRREVNLYTEAPDRGLRLLGSACDEELNMYLSQQHCLFFGWLLNVPATG